MGQTWVAGKPSEANSNAKQQADVCPVPKERKSTSNDSKVCPVKTEPADTPDREISVRNILLGAHSGSSHSRYESKQSTDDLLPSEGERDRDGKIPAAGRGNDETGKNWVNPSANSLFRALARKNKPINVEDAESVAEIHDMVTDQTWAAVMEYERLHFRKCSDPTLARFSGQYGNHSVKARIMQLMGNLTPFDRHDWIVDRCGTEVRYIIDYYAIEEKDPHGGPPVTEYYIDARPSLTPSGVYDRLNLAFKRYRKGEKVW
jgi:cytochrome c heme-lyase